MKYNPANDGKAHSDNDMPASNIFSEFRRSLEVMQDHFFEAWIGTWPTTSDWTAAVMASHLSAALSTFAKTYHNPISQPWFQDRDGSTPGQMSWVDNDIGKYFSQSAAFYFGQNAFGLRLQFYDDMLWVVLGWIDHVKFINHMNQRHQSDANEEKTDWYGTQFIDAFAHRAHVFYELASHGWGTKLCNGGMVWSPSVAPYKNAITNELYISASVAMYLDFPGDDNVSPYATSPRHHSYLIPVKAHDPVFLRAAVEAYDWLSRSNMTNAQGLFVDGYHISGWGRNGSIGTGKCDERNEMVYTYNQGVLLSGLRGLWEGTGKTQYLEDGHNLIRNVIAATGWRGDEEDPQKSWSGIGRAGILEEYCDSSGKCSQDAQTFKGILFHHLVQFCALLPRRPRVAGKTYSASPTVFALHLQSCKEYAPWIRFNANAALHSRDSQGRFGGWWGAPSSTEKHTKAAGTEVPLPFGAVDCRNEPPALMSENMRLDKLRDADALVPNIVNNDLNDRRRGRTVETQGSGLAVIRASHEFDVLCKL